LLTSVDVKIDIVKPNPNVNNPDQGHSYDRTTRLSHIAVVGLGDLGVFLTFAILGKTEHGVALDQALFRTALPFAVVWFAASPWLGCYRASVLRNLKEAAWKIPLTWFFCAPVALLARALLYDRPIILAFALVSVGVQGAWLVGWRCALTVVAQRLSRH
jgi:hypothetical protein